MKRAGKSWMALVAAALLLGALVGVVWARPNRAPRAATVTQKITVPACVFIPFARGFDWYLETTGDRVYCNTGECYWGALVSFPTLKPVTIEKVKLHVYDNSGAYQACGAVYRTRPPSKAVKELGEACSSVAGTTTDPQTITSAAINQVVSPAQMQAANISVYISGQNVYVYGVTVEYHVNP